MIWRCPACGPIAGHPFHGDDDRLHCNGLDCDEIVALDVEIDHAPVAASWQRKDGSPYPAIDCENCRTSFERTGPGQANRRFCYGCKPRGARNVKLPRAGKVGRKTTKRKRSKRKALGKRPRAARGEVAPQQSAPRHASKWMLVVEAELEAQRLRA